MEYFPAPLEKLVEQFARLPGIGGKSAQRLAFFVLGLPEQDAQLPGVPEFHQRRTVPDLLFPEAGRAYNLRGGRPAGRGGNRAEPGV